MIPDDPLVADDGPFTKMRAFPHSLPPEAAMVATHLVPNADTPEFPGLPHILVSAPYSVPHPSNCSQQGRADFPSKLFGCLQAGEGMTPLMLVSVGSHGITTPP